MKRRRQKTIVPAVLGGLLVFWGCQLHRDHPIDDPPPSATVGPTTSESTATSHAAGVRAADSRPAPGLFDAKGVRFNLPADWQPRKTPDFVLMLLPAGTNADEPRITLDVPDLPPHLPWMIQMNRIERDYLADLKKEHADLKLDDASDVKIPNTIARLVRSSWHQNNQPHDDVALLMIHANAVYILEVRADQAQIQKARAAFEVIRSSMQWTK